MSCEIIRTSRLKGLPPGSVVAGKYRIDDVLAEGGMGVIYRGWHLVLDQPVAVKVMRPELVDRPEASLRFLNEARAAACLRGSNVARVLDSGAIEAAGNELLYIVFEYLEGADLRTVLEQKGALSVERTVDFILQACEGLAEAHGVGIVHRDIKPENLFLTRQPDGTEIIKLLDFGISKRMDSDPLSESADSQSLGSPHYMAPEQMSAPHAVDMRADIWSLGIVAYELLTLRVPFDGETVATLCAQVLGREAAPMRRFSPNIPEELDRAILGCLAKERASRYPNVRDLALAIAPFGSSKAQESRCRIQRLFERQPAMPAPIDIDIDFSHLENDRGQRSTGPVLVSPPIPRQRSQSVEVTLDRPRRRRNIVGRVGLAGAAAVAAFAIALPGRSTIASVSSKTWQVLSPLGERARVVAEHPAVQLSRLVPRDGDAAPIAVTPGPTLEEAPPRPAGAPAVRTAVKPQAPAAVRRPNWGPAPAPARNEAAPAELWAPVPEPAATSASEVPDRLIAPYEDRTEKPRGLRDTSRGNLDVAARRYGLGETEFASAGLEPPDQATP